MDQKTADQSKSSISDMASTDFNFISCGYLYKNVETAGATTKGGLESADIWGDADDVSIYEIHRGSS